MGICLDGDGLGVLVLCVVGLGVDFFVLFQVLGPLEGLLADLTQVWLERGVNWRGSEVYRQREDQRGRSLEG